MAAIANNVINAASIVQRWQKKSQSKPGHCHLCGSDNGSHTEECLVGKHNKDLINRAPVILYDAEIQFLLNRTNHGIQIIKWDGTAPSAKVRKKQ